MSFCRKVSVTATTNASGAATVYTDVVNGRILSVLFNDTDIDAGGDATITTETTGQAVLTLTNFGGSDGQWQPRQATHATDSSASLYAASGEPVEDHIWAVDERIKIVIASGGNVKSGVFTVIVG